MDQTAITIIIFGAVQLISIVTTIWSIKTDAKILAVRLDNMQVELVKLSNIVTELVNQSGRILLIEERQLLQGKRMDDLSTRFNYVIDGHAKA